MVDSHLEKIKATANKFFPKSIETLKKYVSLPTISAQNKAIHETVEFVLKMIQEAGGETKLLNDLGGNPVIYGFFPAGDDGDSTKTLLFYNHYDVQPPEPLHEWNTDPFTPTIQDGKFFARGVADNKGDLVARLTAINILKEVYGGLPCNIKFLIEGEEEIGSPNLEKYLKKYRDLFQSDACIWEFGSKNENDQLQMVAGVKGMAYLELTCESADVDMHSSLGAYIDNAAWRLVHALTTMKNEKNDILVDGFFDGISEPTEDEKEAVQNLPFNEDAIKNLYGLKRPLITEIKGIDSRYAMVFQPTMTICGLESGYTGEGAKTVLPKKAKAKIDCRLVPGQDPQHIFECVKKHLEKHGFSDINVELLNGQKAYRSDVNHPFVKHVVQFARDVYEKGVVLSPNSPGTGPMYIFGEYLQLPIVSTGIAWVGSRTHAPNECIRLKDYEEGIIYLAYMIAGLPEALRYAKS